MPSSMMNESRAECPFSVEVEASADNLRLSQKGWSLALCRHSSVTNAVESWEDHYASPVALVPVGSASESDDSVSVNHEDDDEEQDGRLRKQEQLQQDQQQMHQHQQQPPKEADNRGIVTLHPLELVKSSDRQSQSNTTACGEQDSVGMYDCLADQITNLFCPVDHHKTGSGGPQESNSVSAASLSSSASHQIVTTSCAPDLEQLFQSPQGDDNLFTSAFQFWLTPSQEENLRRRQLPPPKPLNRSCASHRRRARHVQRLCDTWYPPTEQMQFVLQRSRSFTSGTSSGGTRRARSELLGTTVPKRKGKTLRDDYYDSDPEQEYLDKRRRMATLLRPKKPSRRRSSMDCHYRRFQPASIDCGYNCDIDHSNNSYHYDMSNSSDSGRSNSSHRNRTTPHHPSLTVNVSDGSTSYETAHTNHYQHPQTMMMMQPDHEPQSQGSFTPTPPMAPRNSDRSPFVFGVTQSEGETTAEAPSRFRKQPVVMTVPSCRDSCGSELSSLGGTPTLVMGRYATSPGMSAAVETTMLQDQQKQQQPQDAIASSSSSYVTVASSTTSATTSATTMSHTSRACPAYFRSPTHWTEFHLLYSHMDDLTKAYVQELSNVRFPLIWHPRANTAPGSGTKQSTSSSNTATATDGPTARPSHVHPCSTVSPAPMAVHGVFEVGAHLEHMVVQPKFTWSPIIQPDLHDKRKILLNESQPNNVELLSIIRVNKPTAATTNPIDVDDNRCTIDRNIYPFPRLDRTVCITTNDAHHPYLVLEAPSREERDWLAVALKLIVARLASIIIVRDEEMLLEFFSPYAALMQLEPEELTMTESSAAATTTASAAVGVVPGTAPTSAIGIPVGIPTAPHCHLSRRHDRRVPRTGGVGVGRGGDTMGPPSSSVEGREELVTSDEEDYENDDADCNCEEEEMTEDEADELITEDEADDLITDDDVDGTTTNDDDIDFVDEDVTEDHDEDDLEEMDTHHDEETRQGPASAAVSHHFGPATHDTPLVSLV